MLRKRLLFCLFDLLLLSAVAFVWQNKQAKLFTSVSEDCLLYLEGCVKVPILGQKLFNWQFCIGHNPDQPPEHVAEEDRAAAVDKNIVKEQAGKDSTQKNKESKNVESNCEPKGIPTVPQVNTHWVDTRGWRQLC
ncbi:hypothetical protein FKM82_002772 [Ascaphus truei]